MSDEGQTVGESLSRPIEEVLNTHGYAFQNAVLRRFHDLINERKSPWTFVAAEYPVEIRGAGTRIDFILERTRSIGGYRGLGYYMVAECKRANPAFSDWFFARSPYTTIVEKKGMVIFDRVRPVDNGDILVEPIEQFVGGDAYSAYHIAIEVKGDNKGDRQGSG